MGHALHAILSGLISLGVGVFAIFSSSLGWQVAVPFIAFGAVLLGLGGYVISALRPKLPSGSLAVTTPADAPRPMPRTDAPPPWAEDPAVADVFDGLGEPIMEFKPATGNIVASIIVWGGLGLLGLAFLIGAIIWAAAYDFHFPVWGAHNNDPDWVRFGILTVAGLGFALCGWLFVAEHRRRFGDRVLLCPGGFINARAKAPQVFAWDDMEKVMQDYADPAKHARNGGPPMTAGTTFLVKHRDGSDFGFGRGTLDHHRQFARMLYAEAQAHGIPWEFYRPE